MYDGGGGGSGVGERLEGEIIQSQMGLASLTVSQGSAAQPV
jgi:hypothetical protein